MKRPNWALRLHLKSPKSSSTATSSEQTNEQSTSPFAVALIGLTALKESADAFPPLKSTVSGILHIIELSQKVKSNKENCQKLAWRVQEILDKIAVAVPDATCIPSDLTLRIDEFTRTLGEIELFMESLCRVKVFKRCLRHKEREDTFLEFNQRLDNVIKSFMLISTVKIEILMSQQGTRLQALSDKSDNVEHRLEDILQKQQVTLNVLFV